MGSHMKCTKMHHNFGPFWSILVHFGAFWCISCVTLWPLHDLYWLLSPFKCPFNPEKDHIGHSGQIRNTFALSWYSEHFGPFWSIWYIFVHFGAPHVWPHDPSMTYTDLTPIPFQESIFSRKRSYKSLRTNSKHFCSVMIWLPFWCILVHFSAFWCILVHPMSDPMTPPWLVLTPIPFQMSI